jgi:hypothetical protein
MASAVIKSPYAMMNIITHRFKRKLFGCRKVFLLLLRFNEAGRKQRLLLAHASGAGHLVPSDKMS